jgi:hypothetical protein
MIAQGDESPMNLNLFSAVASATSRFYSSECAEEDSVLKNSFALISAPGSKAENGVFVVFWPCFGALSDRRPGRHRLFQHADFF